VEALAPRLGASKGSFYWHFTDRPALVGAALELWEQQETADVIRALQELDSPQDRLRTFFDRVFGGPRAGAVDAALAADAHDPQVAAALQRVSRRRLKFLQETFTALGFDKPAASQRALAAYSAYLGLVTLRREAPRLVPARRAAREAHVTAQLDLLTRP
jgi:AcrR family transcriptional regulator